MKQPWTLTRLNAPQSHFVPCFTRSSSDPHGPEIGLWLSDQRRHFCHQGLPLQRLPAAALDLPAVLQEGAGHQATGVQERVRWDLRRLSGWVAATRYSLISFSRFCRLYLNHICFSSPGFIAPDKIDSKFFDPKHAFKEVEVQAKTVRDLIPTKKPKACTLYDGIINEPCLTDHLRLNVESQ